MGFDERDSWARLRFAIIGPLLAAPPERGELYGALRALAARRWRHPASGEDVTYIPHIAGSICRQLSAR